MAVIDPRVLAPFRSRADRCRDDSGMRERPIPAPSGETLHHRTVELSPYWRSTSFTAIR